MDHDRRSRQALIKHWEELGVELIKDDLRYTGGIMHVGGTRDTLALARTWVRWKERKEVFTLKPTFYGVSVDLKELGRRVWSWF